MRMTDLHKLGYFQVSAIFLTLVYLSSMKVYISREKIVYSSKPDPEGLWGACPHFALECAISKPARVVHPFW